VIEHRDGLTVKGPAELRGVSVDMQNFSDTFMTLAALAAFAVTPTIITNIGHTRLQESNRITVMRNNLEKLNIKVEEGDDWIKIYPSQPTAGVVDSCRDHRIAMACSIIGLRVQGIEIDGAECVSKTCPDFFVLWKSLLSV
jgi:3-phosphoshikimate 1-carboxyvinyltransferase